MNDNWHARANNSLRILFLAACGSNFLFPTHFWKSPEALVSLSVVEDLFPEPTETQLPLVFPEMCFLILSLKAGLFLSSKETATLSDGLVFSLLS